MDLLTIKPVHYTNGMMRGELTVRPEGPDEDFQLTRVVQQRRLRGENDVVRERQVIVNDFYFGGFERPRKMVDVADENLVLERGEEAVALGEEVPERAGCSGTGRAAEATIPCFETDACACEETSACVVGDAARNRLAMHAGVEVGKMEEGSCSDDGKRAGGFERKEVDAVQATASRTDVGAKVEFREAACAGDRDGLLAGDSGTDAIHPEGHDSNPGIAVERVQIEA